MQPAGTRLYSARKFSPVSHKDQPKQLAGGGLATTIGWGERALASCGVSMGHCCAVATAAALSSILTGAATFWSRNGDALGVGAKPLPFGAARGQSWATSSTIFCCSPVWHYSSRGLSSRPRACSSDAATRPASAPGSIRTGLIAPSTASSGASVASIKLAVVPTVCAGSGR